MNAKFLVAAACLSATAFAAFAQETHQHSEPGTARAGTSAPAKPAAGMAAGEMHEPMRRMQEQMEKIRNASDPKERHRLVDEHIKSMNEMMSMMRSGMMGAGMMGPGGMMMTRQMMMQEMMGRQSAKPGAR